MADRKRRTRRKRRPRKIEEVVDDDEQEEQDEEQPKRSRRSRRTKEAESPEVHPGDEEEGTEAEETGESEEGEESAGRPAVRVRRRQRKNEDDEDHVSTEIRPKVDEGEEVEPGIRSDLPQTLNMALEGQLVLDMLENMRRGETYVIGKVDEEQWRIAISKEAITVHTPRQLSGVEYEREVCTKEYMEWKEQWGKLTSEEKIRRAEELGCEWERHETRRINVMRAGMAVVDELELVKYKPEYQSRTARAVIRAD